MHVITEKAIKAACSRYPNAKASLLRWFKAVNNASWQNIIEVRRSYPDADAVQVESKKTVTVFNICRNDYRLVTAIHYNRQKVFVLRFMTHADYSKDTWKDIL